MSPSLQLPRVLILLLSPSLCSNQVRVATLMDPIIISMYSRRVFLSTSSMTTMRLYPPVSSVFNMVFIPIQINFNFME